MQELLFINFFFKRGEGNYIQKFLLFEGKDMNVLQQSFMVFELHFSLCQAVYYEGFKNWTIIALEREHEGPQWSGG